MTETKDTTFFAMKLLEFQTAEDPLLAMLEWMTSQLMELEIEEKCNAPKGYNGPQILDNGVRLSMRGGPTWETSEPTGQRN